MMLHDDVEKIMKSCRNGMAKALCLQPLVSPRFPEKHGAWDPQASWSHIGKIVVQVALAVSSKNRCAQWPRFASSRSVPPSLTFPVRCSNRLLY